MWTIYTEGESCWVGFNAQGARRAYGAISIAHEMFEVDRRGVRPWTFQITNGSQRRPYLFTGGSTRSPFVMEAV